MLTTLSTYSHCVCSCTVPGPVSGLSATPGVVQLTISWSPPSEPNGRIIAYQLQIISFSSAMEFNTSDTQYTLRDLPPNTAVVFSVRAYTIIGPGESVPHRASTTSVRKYLLFLTFLYSSLTLGTKGYGSRFVVRSFVLFTALQRAALTSSRQLRYEQAKHVDGLQSDSWILLKCFRSRVMAGSP